MLCAAAISCEMAPIEMRRVQECTVLKMMSPCIHARMPLCPATRTAQETRYVRCDDCFGETCAEHVWQQLGDTELGVRPTALTTKTKSVSFVCGRYDGKNSSCTEAALRNKSGVTPPCEH